MYIIHLLGIVKCSMTYLIYSQLVLLIGKSFVSIIVLTDRVASIFWTEVTSVY